MKSFFKIVRNIVIILIVLVMLVSAVFIFRGHRMYSSALSKMDLDSKVKYMKIFQKILLMLW